MHSIFQLRGDPGRGFSITGNPLWKEHQHSHGKGLGSMILAQVAGQRHSSSRMPLAPKPAASSTGSLKTSKLLQKFASQLLPESGHDICHALLV